MASKALPIAEYDVVFKPDLNSFIAEMNTRFKDGWTQKGHAHFIVSDSAVLCMHEMVKRDIPPKRESLQSLHLSRIEAVLEHIRKTGSITYSDLVRYIAQTYMKSVTTAKRWVSEMDSAGLTMKENNMIVAAPSPR
jgi:hypothetical protein